jgi:hypothetical protein
MASERPDSYSKIGFLCFFAPCRGAILSINNRERTHKKNLLISAENECGFSIIILMGKFTPIFPFAVNCLSLKYEPAGKI